MSKLVEYDQPYSINPGDIFSLLEAMPNPTQEASENLGTILDSYRTQRNEEKELALEKQFKDSLSSVYDLSNEKRMYEIANLKRKKEKEDTLFGFRPMVDEAIQAGTDPVEIARSLTPYVGDDPDELKEYYPSLSDAADYLKNEESAENSVQKAKIKKDLEERNKIANVNNLLKTLEDPDITNEQRRETDRKLKESVFTKHWREKDPETNQWIYRTGLELKDRAQAPKDIVDTARAVLGSGLEGQTGMHSTKGSWRPRWPKWLGGWGPRGVPITKQRIADMEGPKKAALEGIHALAETIGDLPGAITVIQQGLDRYEEDVTPEEFARIVENATAELNKAQNVLQLGL
jgi:hypothetical protein